MKLRPWLAVAVASLVGPALAQGPAAAAFAALAALPATPAVSGGVRVTVRDAEGRPAGDACVVFLADGFRDAAKPAPALPRCHGDEALLLANMLATGTRYSVDERGLTRVPPQSGRLLAFCRDQFAVAAPIVEPGHKLPHVSLQLLPVHAFHVVVVDANDQPADDVPIDVTGPIGRSMPRGHTDPSGRVAFRLVGRRSPQARVRLHLGTNAPIEAPLPDEGAELRLKLPPCGSLRARYSGPMLPGSQPTFRLSVDGRSIEPDVVDNDGALFRRVAIGFTGEATATVDAFTATAKDLPIAVATEAKVTLARASDACSLVVRLLDADGIPLRHALVGVRIAVDRRTRGFGRTTNAEGWIELELQPDPGSDRRIRFVPRRDEGPLGQAELVVGKDEKGRIDRGEQRVTGATIALSGRAVDTAGRPVANVGLRMTGAGGGYVYTGADGRFRLRTLGEKPSSATIALDSDAWFFADPVEKERSVPTEGEARLVLHRAGRLKFTAAGLPSGFQCDFSARLEPATGETSAVELDDFLTGGDELLLPPGHWHLVVREGEHELHRIPDVRIDPAIENHDARFLDFDWRCFATLATIKVVDAAGKPTEACTVWHDYESLGSGTSPDDGIVHWLVPKDGARFRVQPNDSAKKEVDLGVVTGEHTVRIESP
ncbi:MAG: carboxypeptidase regulatory-like domain-containing protein [Planctomycetes bacterium]|nr:carboxypeptidase regulatory-like domain-containing protein [Planctomycetota bacterium]